jgi:hypothetical protein
MQWDSNAIATGATLAASSLVAILTIVVVRHGRAVSRSAAAAAAATPRDRDRDQQPYRDEDGAATPESAAAFSTKWQKSLALLWATTGFGCQIALSVLLLLGVGLVDSAPSGSDDGAFVFMLSLQSGLITAAWVRNAILFVCFAPSLPSSQGTVGSLTLSFFFFVCWM